MFMQKTLKAIMVCALSASLAVACSSSSNNNGSNNTSGSNPQPGSLSAKYQGTYLMACTPDGGGGWMTEELTITGQTVEKIDTDYSDAQCANPTLTTKHTATISYPGGTTTTGQGQADHVDAVLVEKTENGVSQVILPSDTLIFTIFALADPNTFYQGDDTAQFDGKTAATREGTLKTLPLIRQ